jgi:8-oxo-dGTP pyrophosphatase MutT (NUDIX family)/phosphohistidine phosphatase SixA
MPDRKHGAVIRAAGAVVWRPGVTGAEIALVHRPRYDDWSYPKGKCERGEHVLSTALREVVEETGLRVILGRPLRPRVYRTGAGTKRVNYWAARCAGSVGFVPGSEVDQVAWLPAAAARGRLTYARDAELLDDFLARPARSVPFILLRHATAGRKSAAGSDDLTRPLDPRGSADAKLLASLLCCYGSCRVISSAAERCLATVRPYAAAVGAPVQIEPAFTVPDGDLAASRAAELAGSGIPTLVCAHRENMPGLLDAACGALGASPPQGPPLAKGAFWVLQSAGGVLLSAEQHNLAS